jgi:hypothetical protein
LTKIDRMETNDSLILNGVQKKISWLRKKTVCLTYLITTTQPESMGKDVVP